MSIFNYSLHGFQKETRCNPYLCFFIGEVSLPTSVFFLIFPLSLML
jgi:hypothetical protein